MDTLRMHFLDIKLSSAKQEKLLPKDMAIILSNTHSGFPSTFSKRPLQIRAYSVLYDSISGKSGPEIALVKPETLESFESELDIAMLDVESLLSRVCLVQGQCLVAEIAKALCVDFENVKVDLGYSSETDGRRNPELTCIYREDKAVRLCVDTRTGYIQVALLGGGSDTLMESTGISTLAQLGPVPATEGEKESVVAVRKMEESLQKDWRSVTGLIENLKYATYLEQIKMDVELSCSGVKFLDNLPFDESIVAAFCKPKVPKHIGVVRLEEWDQSFVAIAVGQHGELDSDNERKEMIAGPVYKAWIIMIGDGSTGSSSSSLKLYIPIKRDNISFFLNSERKEAETPRNEEHSKRRKKTTLSAEHLTDPGNQYLWTEMGSEVLSLIFSYARKQLAWLTVSAQVRDMALDYDLCFPQEYAMSPIPAHSLAMVAPKITIHPFYFDIERKIQAKSDPNLDRSATEEDKSSRYCFGNLYLGVEKAFSNGNTKETDMVVGRVRLTNEILPKVGLVKMDSPLASFDANHSVITLAIPHSDISAKEILRHWKGLAAIAEVASQIWTRQQWFLAHGIEIASYAVGMLTMRVEAWGILKFDGNGSSLLRLRWRRFVTDLVASKNPENEGGKAKGLDQFILESVCENGELEENVDEAKAAWIMKLQSLLNDCLDMVVFAKHLHPVSSLMKRLLEVEAISNSVENRVNGEQDVKVVAKSLSWIRFIQGVYGLDFYLFTNDTMIVYDASAGGPDGIFDPALKPIPNFSRSTQALPNAKAPLLEKLPEYLKSSSQPSEIKLKELPRGILFGLNAQDSILPIILKYVDAWAANSTTMSFLVDESTLKIHCKRSDNLCNSGWMWNGSWLFGVQSTQPGQAEIMEQLAKYLRAKFSSVQALTRNIRPPMLSYLNFMHLPDTVLSDFNRFCAEETRKDGVSTRATWCLVMPTNPPTKLAHLPKPGELAFFVDFSISRISLVFKIMAADGTHRILPLHYNYKTRFVGLWKPEPNPDDLTLEDASNPFFQAKVKQLAEDASLPSLEKIFLKLSRTNVPLDKGGPEKAFQAVRYVITKYSSVASELSDDSSFETVRRDKRSFVDKSLFIAEVVSARARVSLILRPRRFGKSLNLSMLKSFFDVSGKEENRKLFEGLRIEREHPRLFEETRQGAFGCHPVIALDLKDIKALRWEDMLSRMRNLISRTYSRFGYLVDSDSLLDHEKALFRRIKSNDKTVNQSILESSLRNLSAFLTQHHKTSCVILIDEFDTPLQSAYQNGFFEEANNFYNLLFSALLKGNDENVFKAVLVGILRVSKPDLLNNLKVYSFQANRYTDKFGFTAAEVHTLLSQYQEMFVAETMVSKWYNGYQSNDVPLFNPFSIINLCARGIIRNYWADSGGTAAIQTLFQSRTLAFKKTVLILMTLKPVRIDINESLRYHDCNHIKDDSDVWTLLYYAGYLSVNHDGSFRIPNMDVYSDWISWLLPNLHNKLVIHSLAESFLKGDVQDLSCNLSNTFANSFSYFDVIGAIFDSGAHVEAFWCAFCLGLFIWARDCKLNHVKWNHDVEFGRL
ncbi:hypothetical protein BDR26DRAFT_1008716 [Obelidium mucronatum]|nr:hypothetical protein BDR26DRAFT_1008716 [Obelidium mucronatum]